MANRTISLNRQFEDREIWESLKQAISASSGFKRWQQEQPSNEQSQADGLDAQVSCYLRETLATLAY